MIRPPNCLGHQRPVGAKLCSTRVGCAIKKDSDTPTIVRSYGTLASVAQASASQQKRAAQVRSGSKTGKAQTEHMFSGSPPLADINESRQHFRIVQERL